MSSTITRVQKRKGELQPFIAQKVKESLKRLCYPTTNNKVNMNVVDVDLIYNEAYGKMEDGMSTDALSFLLVDACLLVDCDFQQKQKKLRSTDDEYRQQYKIIARRIIVTSNHKSHDKNLVDFVKQAKDKLVSFKLALEFIEKHASALQNVIKHHQDTFYPYGILRHNKIGRFQFVLLLLVVHYILVEHPNETKQREDTEEDFVLNMVKSEYRTISQNPREVARIYREWQTELRCQ